MGVAHAAARGAVTAPDKECVCVWPTRKEGVASHTLTHKNKTNKHAYLPAGVHHHVGLPAALAEEEGVERQLQVAVGHVAEEVLRVCVCVFVC